MTAGSGRSVEKAQQPCFYCRRGMHDSCISGDVACVCCAPESASAEQEQRRYVATLSGGKGSWAAVRYLIDVVGVAPERITGLFTDTNGEDPDLYRFLAESTANLGVELVTLDNDGRTIWDVFRKERMIGNTRLSVCSRALKQQPAHDWLKENGDPADTTVVVGIDWTEAHRLTAITRNYQPFDVTAPLAEPGAWSHERIDKELQAAGIDPPRLYAAGFPHNNCGGACVRAGQGQWALLLRTNPERYAEEERQENAFRADLGKDVSILRDRTLRSRLAAIGLTESDVATVYEDGDDPGTLVHRDTGEEVNPPSMVPLTLTVLRERERDDEVDMLDLGGCGCMSLPMDDDLSTPPASTPEEGL